MELNQTKSVQDRQTDGQINEVRALPLGKWERIIIIQGLRGVKYPAALGRAALV